MPALTQTPNALPEGATYFKAYATSDLYVGVPAIAQSGGTASFAATLTGVSASDLVVLEPPLDYATGAASVTYTGFRVSADTITVLFAKNPVIQTSSMYVAVPAMSQGGTGSFTATITGLNPGDYLFLEPPLNWKITGG